MSWSPGQLRPLRPQEDREDVCDEDANVTFNHLQQREAGDSVPTLLEEAGGTDPWGVT